MTKCPLIVIAGWGYPASALAELCQALAPDIRTVPVSTHDLGLVKPGESGADVSAPMSAYAAALEALIRKQVGKVSVVGWSMGGLVALEVAALYPELIDRLALIASTPKFCAGKDFACGVPVANVRAMRLGLNRDPDATLAGFYRLATEPFTRPAAAIPDQVSGWQDELTAGLDFLARTDLRSCLEQVRAPTLVLHGREDRVIPWQAADYLNRGLHDSRLRLYDGVGHDLPLREPIRVADDIRKFLT